MATLPPYRAPVPLFIPALSAALVLLVLFIFGVREQQQLADASSEQIINQRAEIARIVAEAIQSDMHAAEASVRRFGRDLAVNLEAPQPEAAADFDNWFQPLPDGSIRSRLDRFDPVTDAAVWIPNYLKPDAKLREFFVRAKSVTELYGRGAYGQVFADTWILPAASGILIFWPEQPEFVFQATADFDYRNTIWLSGATPANNPNRHPFWTNLEFDPSPKIWMLSVVMPFYWRGEWYGSVGHDLPLARLLERTTMLRQQRGSEFILITADDTVAASDIYADAIQSSQGKLKVAELPNPLWQQAIAAARADNSKSQHLRVDLPGHVGFVARIHNQNWLLVNLLPLAPITTRIDQSFANLRNIAIGTLLLELLIATGVLAWNHQRSRRYFQHLHDITEQLVTSETHYRTLVANIPGMVYRCANDADWTMAFVSPAAFELTGYPAEEFLDNRVRSFASIIHPDDQSRVTESVTQAVARRQPFAIEYRICCRDGRIRWVLEQGRLVQVKPGADMLEGIILDTTPLKQAEAALRELNLSLENKVELRTAELRSAIKELETFNYAVSHDLRAPLRHVMAYLELLAEQLGTHPDAQIGDLLHRCQQSLKRMNELIAGMLSLAQLGREALMPIQVDLSVMVQELLQEVPLAQRERVRFDIGPLPLITADRVLLRQVLQNLIDNALKYSSGQPQPLVSIHDCTAGGDAEETVIEVRDNGVGFDAHYADKLFQLFQRLHRNGEFPGSGVGLALAAKIMALHGGRIWAQSRVDQGASFFIAFPRQSPVGARR